MNDLKQSAYFENSNLKINEYKQKLTLSSPMIFKRDFVSLSSSEVLIEIEKTADILIKNGNTVNYNFHSQKLVFEDLLKSLITGILLLQKRNMVLHGNAFTFNNKTMAICGESGVGKSSLAANFSLMGAKFISDEIIALNTENQLIPGFPYLRLWKNDCQHFEDSVISQLWEDQEKFKVDAQDFVFKNRRPLENLIYIELSREISSVEITEVKGLRKLDLLWNSIYRRPLIEPMGLVKPFQKKALNIVKNLKIFSLRRPIDGDSKEQCMKLIQETIF